MRMHKRLMRLGLSSFAGLIVLAGLAGSTPPGAVGVVSAQEPEEQYHPCGVEAKREIEPRIVEEGGVISVKVHYNYNCISGVKKINFILLVEATISEQNIADRNGLLLNLKDGLKNFVNTTSFSNGTTGGLTLVGEEYTNRVPLRGDREGKDRLLEAIELISLKPIGGAVGFGGALNDAVGRLPTNVADENENWVIVFDRGAPEIIAGNPEPPVTIAEACDRARRSKVNVAVVSHQDAPYRFDCTTRGFGRRSSGPKAPDLPTIFRDLADAIVRGKQAKETLYQDYAYNDAFAYVEASGRPRDPDDVRGSPPYDITWRNKDNTKPPGGFNIDYQWRALTDLTDPVTKISVEDFPSILFLWADGTYDEFTLDDPVNNPEVCVYRKGKMQQDCGNFSPYTPTPEAETPTPEPATPTPTATEVPPTLPPTAVVPTNTPVPTTAVPPTLPPTYTPVPTQEPLPGLYLPALLRSDNLGSF